MSKVEKENRILNHVVQKYFLFLPNSPGCSFTGSLHFSCLQNLAFFRFKTRLAKICHPPILFIEGEIESNFSQIIL
jgi:hypothetical protein